MASVTREELAAGLKMVQAIAEAIREAKEIPSGHLYAIVMGRLSISAYQQILGILTRTGLVLQCGDLLKWNEPKA